MQNVRPQGNAHLQNQSLDSPETVFLQRHGASRCISVLRHLATAREKPRPPLSVRPEEANGAPSPGGPVLLPLSSSCLYAEY